MARSRDIRPEFFTDEKVGDLAYGERLLFIGIWCHSDLRGVFEYSAKQLRVLVFPFDEGLTSVTVQGWLDSLESHGFIFRFEAEGKTWGCVKNWHHQGISGREKDIGTKRPEPPGYNPGSTQVVPRDNPGSTQVASPSPSPSPSPSSASSPANPKKEKAASRPSSSKNPVRDNPPSLDEVREYIAEMGYRLDPAEFHDANSRGGWAYGKGRSPVMDWKAHVRTWENRRKAWNETPIEKPKTGPSSPEPMTSEQREYALWLEAEIAAGRTPT